MQFHVYLCTFPPGIPFSKLCSYRFLRYTVIPSASCDSLCSRSSCFSLSSIWFLAHVCVLGSYSFLCSMGCLWLLAVTGSCGCWVPNGSSSYLSFLWFLVVSSGCSDAVGSLWFLSSWFPVIPQGPRVTCDSLWFPGFPPVTCGSLSSACYLWLMVPRVACGSSWFLCFLRFLGSLVVLCWLSCF